MGDDSGFLLLEETTIENCMSYNAFDIHYAESRELRYSIESSQLAHSERFVQIEAQDDADADIGSPLVWVSFQHYYDEEIVLR
jgi:hypothetical protein